MIPEPVAPTIVPMEQFTLRRLMAGRTVKGHSFAIYARSDRLVMYSVGFDFSWTEAGACRDLAEAQSAVEAAIASRAQASASSASSERAS